jgi:hexosaminidase
LTVSSTGVVIRADQPAGLFAGVETLLQLLPPAVESPTVQPGPWAVPGGTVVDYPRFAYRGAMLDVARHFFTVAQVEQYIDEISLYKINYLHLHLSDDQGWRIQINGWPELTAIGGSTEVGGGTGGYYTQADYEAIVAYAQQHYITVIPEIDMPGHTNAALASYAELNCNGVAPPLYTGTDVGFSSLCTSLPITYTFLTDVIDQLAAITPGGYIDIGGDEATSTTASDYKTFETKVQAIVAATGKTAIGWDPNLSTAPLLPSTVAQFWDTTTSDPTLAAAAANGTKIIMSPANHAYLDMKYTKSTTLGQNWAGYTDVKKAYNWDPGAYLSGVSASAILGVEAPLWSETLLNSADIQYRAFPRLAAIAELGWSPESTHVWKAFDVRIGDQGPRWRFMGINYYHSTQVTWPTGS